MNDALNTFELQIVYLLQGTLVFTVSGITTAPAANDIYSNNSAEFKVQESSITDGSGTITCTRSGGVYSNDPQTSGNLTRVSGAGDATIAFSAWVGGYNPNNISEVSYGNVHQKFKEDLRKYYAHQLPAIGVMSFNGRKTDYKINEIDLKIQVVNVGGDLASIDETVKTITWKIMQLLEGQRPSGGGRCLRDNAEDIYNIDSQIITGQLEGDNQKKLVICLGEISCTIQFLGV